VYAVSCYVVAMLLLTLIALKYAPETAHHDLTNEHPDAIDQTATA
jgi:hypothetical protein